MKKLLIAFMALNAAVISIYVYDRMNSPKTGYIVIQEVFNGFELKKDYERRLLATKNKRQKIADSLELELKMLGKKIEAEKGKNQADITKFEIKREDYLQKRKLFEEDDQAQTKKYDEEIVTQLSQYVKDFGKQEGYTYILGNDGNGSLMYATDAKNLTRQIVAYINDRYKGVK
jgi:outer membrane protein